MAAKPTERTRSPNGQRRAPELAIMLDARCYSETLYGKTTLTSFDYVLRKSIVLAEWLKGFGYDVPRVSSEYMGEARGWNAFKALCRMADEWHGMTGDVCTGMLVERLIGYEGRKVGVRCSNGDQWHFFVERKGNACPTHMMTGKPGYKFGKRAPDSIVEVWELTSALPLANDRVMHIPNPHANRRG